MTQAVIGGIEAETIHVTVLSEKIRRARNLTQLLKGADRANGKCLGYGETC